MKKRICFFILGLILNFSQAAEIIKAQYDSEKKNIVVDVAFNGGCAKHFFTFEHDGCRENTKADCQLLLVERTKDICSERIQKRLTVSLEELDLDARLSIIVTDGKSKFLLQ